MTKDKHTNHKGGGQQRIVKVLSANPTEIQFTKVCEISKRKYISKPIQFNQLVYIEEVAGKTKEHTPERKIQKKRHKTG